MYDLCELPVRNILSSVLLHWETPDRAVNQDGPECISAVCKYNVMMSGCDGHVPRLDKGMPIP